MLIQIGSTKLYTSTLNSDYDTWLNSEMDPFLNSELEAETTYILNESAIQIDHYVDGRATAGFAVFDVGGIYIFYERQQVTIRDLAGALVFGGVVQSCESIRIPGSVAKIHTIAAADYTAILDWRIVDYAEEDQLAGDAVLEILADYLAAEGITEGEIESGNLLTQIEIANKSAYQGLTKLAEACGFVCYLDYDLKLYFHIRSLYAADWSITDESDILNESLTITRQNDAYRNAETIIGGYEETSLQTEPFKGDGTTKTFPMAYPVNRMFGVTVGGAAKTIGQKGEDIGLYDCYYAVNSETLTFDVAPGNGVTGEAQYYGLWRAKYQASDDTAIAVNATRQGFGTGRIEHITIDESLKSLDAARDCANAKLTEFAKDGITIEYKTRRAGLAAGTLQHIDIQDVDYDFLITHVGEEHKDGDTEYSVSACYGPVSEEWDLFFRDAFTNVYQVREGLEEGIGVQKLYNFAHTWDAADRPNPFTSAAIGEGLAVSSDLWPSFALTNRIEYLQFYSGGVGVFRKQITSIANEASDDIMAATYIAAAEAVGEIAEIGFFAGDSATVTIDSGVLIYRTDLVKTKNALESMQVNFNMLDGA